MEWIEVHARTITEAKELALDRLGVVEAELEFEVLKDPKPGLFGVLGRADARIRARVKPISREKPNDRRRRGKDATARGGGRRGGGGRAQPQTTGRSGANSGRSATSQPTGGDGGSGDAAGARPRRRRRRSGGGQTPVGAGGSGQSGRRTEDTQVDESSMPIGEQADVAATFTEEVIEGLGLRAEVRALVEETDVRVDVVGADLGVLVGPRGATLHALEELVRTAVQHAAGGRSARVHVDVAGYRQRRREALAAFTEQIAVEVRDAGTERALEPMNAADRKVVHDTVADLEGVSTISEGEEPRRRVVIRPA